MENNIKHIYYPNNISTFRRLYSKGVISEEEYYAASRLLYKGYIVEEITKELLAEEIKEFNDKLRKNLKQKIIVTSVVIAVLLFSVIIISSINQNKTTPRSEASTVMVYITRTGSKYHRIHCSYLRSSKIEITLENAIEESYSPCSRCNPPKTE